MDRLGTVVGTAVVAAFGLAACSGGAEEDRACRKAAYAPATVPAPAAQPRENAGPGGPTQAFASEQLYRHCAYLQSHPDSVDHHNLVVMHDGYLVLPAAPEWGGGSLSFWDVSDGCAPQRVGTGWHDLMRESHSISFSTNGGGEWAVVNDLVGVQFWDITDKTAPTVVSRLKLPGVFYPDAYGRVVFAVFWQGDYVYAAGTDNGIFIVDASDPTQPTLAARYDFDPPLRIGGIFLMGNLLMATATEGVETQLLDISDPLQPQPIAGGRFATLDGQGDPVESYLANTWGERIVYARKDRGGGALVWDISDPGKPHFLTELVTQGGNGGYVFAKDNELFVGDSNWAMVGDFSDLDAPREVTRLTLTGDLDTAIPLANMVVLSVDDEANPGEGSAMVPLHAAPDTQGPTVNGVFPRAGAVEVAASSRIGLSFREMVDTWSVHLGSVTIRDSDGHAVPGRYNVQENLVNFTPDAPLRCQERYTVSVPAGGVADYAGNRTPTGFTATFTTR